MVTRATKKILVTGATGLIGKECLHPLLERGFEVYALCRNPKQTKSETRLKYIGCDLFDEHDIRKVIQEVKADCLLHLAWITENDYVTSNLNFEYVRASLCLLKHFQENGGKRAILAGTCSEYDYSSEPLAEEHKKNPLTPYAKAKDGLRRLAEAFCEHNDIAFAWGIIFYVYGHQENPKRLIPQIIQNLQNEQTVSINYGNLKRDYMYTKDLGNAFAALADATFQGSVNLCTGKGESLSKLAQTIAKKVKKEYLLDIKHLESNQPDLIVGDNSKMLYEVGYTPQYDFDKALANILTQG